MLCYFYILTTFLSGKVCKKACEQLYYSSKSQQKTDFIRNFEILWKRYTSRDIAEDLGFIDYGGNSFLALQFTTALTNVSRVPNDFIVALLSNVKYSRCLELLSSMNNVESNESSMHDHKRSLTDLKNDEIKPQKRIKFEDSCGRLERVICRGETRRIVDVEKYHTSSEVLSNDMKVKWKYDMRKCVDASPTVLVYEKYA